MRLPKYTREQIVAQLDRIDGQLVQVLLTLDRTDDQAPKTRKDASETAGDWVVQARTMLGEATRKLKGHT